MVRDRERGGRKQKEGREKKREKKKIDEKEEGKEARETFNRSSTLFPTAIKT